MLIFAVEREVSSVHGYSKLLLRSARTSYKLFPVFVVVVFFYWSCTILSFSVFFLFISNICSFNVHANIEASSSQSMGKTNPVPGLHQPLPPLEY